MKVSNSKFTKRLSYVLLSAIISVFIVAIFKDYDIQSSYCTVACSIYLLIRCIKNDHNRTIRRVCYNQKKPSANF